MKRRKGLPYARIMFMTGAKAFNKQYSWADREYITSVKPRDSDSDHGRSHSCNDRVKLCMPVPSANIIFML
jgi:hypothetical protein